MLTVELLCGGCVGGGLVCTVIFVSTPSPTDLEWTVRLDWSLTISIFMLLEHLVHEVIMTPPLTHTLILNDKDSNHGLYKRFVIDEIVV